MKQKFIFKVIHLWVICALLIGWVWLFAHVFEQGYQVQKYVLAFFLAPVSEELLYRWLPVHLEKQFPRLKWFPGVFANFLFIAIHEDNYPYAGVYWAFAVQGALGFVCLYACRKYGLWASILIHIKYNLAIAFII